MGASAGCLQEGEPEDEAEDQVPDQGDRNGGRVEREHHLLPVRSQRDRCDQPGPCGEDGEGHRGQHRPHIRPPIDAQRERELLDKGVKRRTGVVGRALKGHVCELLAGNAVAKLLDNP